MTLNVPFVGLPHIYNGHVPGVILNTDLVIGFNFI